MSLASMTEKPHSLSLSSPSLASVLDEDWELTICLTVDPDTTEELWALYHRSFEGLRTRAAQRHLMSRAEFDDLLNDERVDKIIVRDRGGERSPAGLSIMTNRFEAVPLVSGAYFRERWPEHYDQGRVWYVGFVAVAFERQRTKTMRAIIQHVCDLGGRVGGVFAVDICEYNEDVYDLPAVIARLGSSFNPGVIQRRLDAQVYWAYEIPREQE